VTPGDLDAAQTMLPALMLSSIRPGAAFLAAPIFGLVQVPVLLRLILALAVGVPSNMAANIVLPDGGLASLAGALLIGDEVLIGLALGFALQTGFAAASIAGELIGNAMGLSLATTIDPLNGGGAPALSQAMSILTTLLFLSIDGHLAFVTVVIDSYRTIPLGAALLSWAGINGIGVSGVAMFAGGMTLGLPVVTGVILIQLVMALLARSAPAMNLFAVGLPAALLGGLVLLAFALPVMGQAIVRLLGDGLDAARMIR
jgi:flagellar biosynthesis protein FliR